MSSESKWYFAVNAEASYAHYSHTEMLVQKYSIKAVRMWNLNKTGTTPSNNAKEQTRLNQYMRGCGVLRMRVPGFVHTNRATFMLVVSAERQTGPPLLVFKGKCLLCREISFDEQVEMKTYATCSSRDAM